MNAFKMLCTILAAAVTGINTAGTATAETKLRVLSSWPKVLENVRIIEKYGEYIHEASNGRISVTINGPEVVPGFEQLDPVSRGSFDILFTTGSYHSGATGIGMGPDTFKIDPALWRKSGVKEWIDAYYRKKLNLRLLAIVAASGYRLVLKNPPDPDGKLTGRKIRGTVAYHTMIRKLGASPVVMDVSSMYSSLEKGVIDGYAWPRFGQMIFKFHEAGAIYAMEPVFGGAVQVILMNADRFAALPKSDQQLMIDQGERIARWSIEHFKRHSAAEERLMRQNGVHFLPWPSEGKNLQRWYNEGVWELVVKLSGKEGAEFKRFVEQKDLLAE